MPEHVLYNLRAHHHIHVETRCQCSDARHDWGPRETAANPRRAGRRARTLAPIIP
jgi:hypothetical protein